MRPDPYLPWPGNPRRFYAMAMPNGDRRLDARIEGPLVFIKEQRVGLTEPGNIYTRAEAEQLYAELGRALAAFDLAKDMAREVACEIGASCSAAVGQQGSSRPVPYLGPYPIRGATLAEVDAAEARAAAA